MPPKSTAKPRASSPSAKATVKAATPAKGAASAKAAAPAKAGVPAKSGATTKAVPPTPAATSDPVEDSTSLGALVGDGYQGSPLDMEAAQAFLTGLSPVDMAALAKSVDPEEQLPARMMLEFVGDKDHTWGNAQKSLKDGATFKKEIADMDGCKFITKGSVERYDSLGKLAPKALESRQPAAFAMAVYLEACIDAAKDKLDLKPKIVLAPEPDEEPPAWPIKIDIKEIPSALADALKWRRTPLFVCNGKAKTVDAYFTYQACTVIDAKWILQCVDIKKEQDVPQMRESLRNRLIGALKFGQPVHVAMSNSAVTMNKYCGDDQFPEGLFKQKLWLEKEVYSKVVREADLSDWPGAFPGRMKDDGASYVFITTDFSLESAHEHLIKVLPHFEDMAMIEIDADSVNS